MNTCTYLRQNLKLLKEDKEVACVFLTARHL